MAFDRFLIAPFNSGKQTDTKPWLIPEDAFDYLQNAYVFRGRVRKRFGTRWMGTSQLNTRLRVNLGNTDGAGDKTVSVPGKFAVGQMFSVGTQMFTVNVAGNPANMLSTGTATGTFDTTTGQVIITGAAPATALYFYPSLPVMGITQYESGSINNHPTFAFDTQFAYLFSGGAWDRSGTALWDGTDINYFWSTNWESVAGTTVLFVTNFNATTGINQPSLTDDPIWTYDGTNWVSRSGVDAFFFRPTGLAPKTGPFVQTARLIVVFKNRLILLNTIENDNSSYSGVGPIYEGTATAYTNRARYCFYGSPFAVNAWYEKNTTDTSGNVAAGGGYVDAATDEQIISAEFIKDRLIVYFERSTWELVYTNNQVLPFVWQKINTELGSQSTFSVVPFDQAVLGIGQSGIHACSGTNTSRIDDKIPDTVFDFQTKNNAPVRTAGIRDYYTELVYWTFVDDLKEPTQKFPNQVLVYNYKNGSWALNDDCLTTFGYFEQATDMTWASSSPIKWENAGFSWNSNVIQANQRQILCGTPEGYILVLDPELARNAAAMQVTNITYAATGILTLTIVNHNLTANPIEFDWDQDFILLENIVGDATTMATLNGNIFQVFTVVDANTITIDTTGRIFAPLTSGTYSGGGTAARVSNIQIRSKQWNPYVDKDRNFYLSKIDFGVTKTGDLVDGQIVGGVSITVDYYPSSSETSMLSEGQFTGARMGNGVLETAPYDPRYYPFELQQKILWHPINFQSYGTFIQIAMSFSFDQMIDPKITLDQFELHGMALYCQPIGRLQ